MAAEALTSFLAELEKYQVLNPSQLLEAQKLASTPASDPKLLATELIRRGWVTPFQANQLLQGRGPNLVLGPYVLLERLGAGGMGEVFKARHLLMDRVVALKVIRTDRREQPDLLGRFRREMQATAKLAHPNVVLAHDAGLAGDRCYLVVEYVEGTDLARLLKRRGRLPPDEACTYIRQAALGLQHAHERGLVHRDIKPSNLILATDGVVKILDLGLARLLGARDSDAGSELTSTGLVVGTPDYLAPEQAADSHTVDIRADIYSLGCTLYHLVTGQVPFPGGTFTQKVLKHQQAEPEPVERLCPAVVPGLAGVVRTMMARQPQDRYPTPGHVAAALAPFAAPPLVLVVADHAPEGQTPATTVSGPAEPTGVALVAAGSSTLPPAGNRTVRWTAVSLAVVLPVLVAVILAVSLLRPTAAGKPGADGVASRPPGTGTQPALPLDTRPGVEPASRAPAEPASLVPLPAEGAARLIAELKGHTGNLLALAFSADGKWLASGGDDNQVRVWDAGTGKLRGRPWRHNHPVRALAWAPDGRQLAAGTWGGGYEAEVKLWDLLASAVPRTLTWQDRTGTPSLADVRALAYSPDGKRLAACGGPLRIWDLSKSVDPAVHPWQETFPSYAYGVVFAADGKTVAAGCHESGDSVRLWTVDGQGAPLLLRGNVQAFGLSHSDVRGVVAFVAGGKRFVRVTSDGRGPLDKTGSVMVWDVDAAEQQLTFREKHKVPGGAVYTLASATNGQLRIAAAAGAPGFFPRLPPEPAMNEVQLWDTTRPQAQALATGHQGAVTALALSPDGTRLATGGADQTVRLWQLAP